MYKSLTSRECAELIAKASDTDILIHIRPDGDAVGSAAALSVILGQLGRRSSIVCADPIPERLHFIIEKVGVEVLGARTGRNAISMDSASPSQLGALYSEDAPVSLMIDHHAIGDHYADNFVIPDASSAGEVLYLVARELIKMGLIEMTETLAYALYTSISSDTGRFSYSDTTAETYRIAADLIETGIDFTDINHKLFSTKTKAQLKAEGLVASSIKTLAGGRIAYVALSLRDKEENGLTDGDLDTAIDIIRSLKGAEIALFLREVSPNKYKASMRSLGANVAEVAKRLGGGGHIRAAGCSPTGESLKEALDKTLAELLPLVGEGI